MDDVTIGAAGLLLAGLTYFAGVQRGKATQKQAEQHAQRLSDATWRREEESKRQEESARRVAELVKDVQWRLTPAGGTHGCHLETLQEAGIRALSDIEIRAAMKEIAHRTRIALPDEEWSQLEQVDLKKVFAATFGRINLSGGKPTLVRVVASLKADGIDVQRDGV